MLNILNLQASIAATCPVQGVSVGDPTDRDTWRVDFDAEATPEQRAAAQGLLATWEPTPPRRLIPKSTVQERINDIGKLGDAFTALNSAPILFGRWFVPDWPNVYADDEGLLQLLASIGCTAEQIAAITAPV